MLTLPPMRWLLYSTHSSHFERKLMKCTFAPARARTPRQLRGGKIVGRVTGVREPPRGDAPSSGSAEP
eukprot:SAG11_NODE_16975_length_532_cov_1.041570_1_plen_67_part_01